MGFWDALSSTMRTLRRRRIGPREAERLLTAERVGSEHVELSLLLNAVAAPPRPHELLNHEPAVAAFERAGPFHRARRGTGPVPTGPGRARWRRLTRSTAVKAIVGTTAILIGGTAYAAETGRLPDAAQRQAHDLFSSLGVPAPGGAAPVGGSPTATQTPTSTATPGGGRTPGPDNPTEPGLLGLCRAWQAVQEKPNGEPMAAESFRNLAEAAGGQPRIPTFCAPLLAERPGRAPALPTPARDPRATPQPDAGIPTSSNPGGGQVPGRPTSLPNRKGLGYPSRRVSLPSPDLRPGPGTPRAGDVPHRGAAIVAPEESPPLVRSGPSAPAVSLTP